MSYSFRMTRASGQLTENELDEALQHVGANQEAWPSQWFDGQAIFDGPPDDANLVQIVRAAERLNAVVLGDDGERYFLSNGELRVEPGA